MGVAQTRGVSEVKRAACGGGLPSREQLEKFFVSGFFGSAGFAGLAGSRSVGYETGQRYVEAPGCLPVMMLTSAMVLCTSGVVVTTLRPRSSFQYFRLGVFLQNASSALALTAGIA